MKDPLYIQQMLKKGRDAGVKADNEFAHLSLHQLNWKPSPEKWSVGQCLEHLIVSNTCYFPTFERIVTGSYKMTVWQRWSPLSGLFGKFVSNQTQEEVKMKLKTAKVFTPASSNIDTTILSRFQKNLDDLLKYLSKLENTDLDKTRISSPVSKFITYSLRNAIKILVPHLHRHINQGIRVKQSDDFPSM